MNNKRKVRKKSKCTKVRYNIRWRGNIYTQRKIPNDEFIYALRIVDKFLGFGFLDTGRDDYGRMFSDSATASTYRQEQTKTKYIIQFGLAHYISNEVIALVKSLFFKFDESTTQKKQYDRYII